MPKVKLQATKMSDARVDYISLVARPANRSPIKIVKQEQNMAASRTKDFDLGSLFTRKSEKTTPKVVGVVTLKTESFEEVKGLIADAGFKVEDVIELEDDSVVFKQEDFVEGEGVVIRMNDNAALITKGFRPYNMDMSVGDTSFSDMAAAQGFYPSVSTVLDVVRNSIYGVVEKADSPDSAATAVSKMFDEAKSYAASMIRGLPVMAFKLEQAAPAEKEPDPVQVIKAFGKLTPEMKAKMKAQMDANDAEDDPAQGGDSGKDEAAEDAAKAKAKKAEDDAKAAKDAEAAVAAKKAEAAAGTPADGKGKAGEATPVAAAAVPLTTDDVSRIVGEHVEKSLGVLASKMESLMATLSEGVKKSVDGMTTSMTDLTAQVKKADEKAQAVSDTLGRLTVGGSGKEDANITLTPARKAETGMGGREIDTAYLPRSARRRQ